MTVRCGMCDNYSGRMPLCGTCHAFFTAGMIHVKLSEETIFMLRLAVNGIHRQSKVGRIYPLEKWNLQKERRFIRQNPSGYCYTTWLGNELLKRHDRHLKSKTEWEDKHGG